ncbi:uncharacterized protein LOC135951962 [Calliphora vicina]|uniref:uncharacterized protein LOC135951962 n=1 Tax=Calliphora vicina TaxID=7373 RepID=UPI00325B8E1F
MENNQDIAKGFVKGDKVAKELLWKNLTEKLNSSGPPTKDCSGWKKTWADWKIYVKNKLSHNKRENLKTGGGEYNKYVLSDIEESVIRLSGVFRQVEGIDGAVNFADSDVTLLLNDEIGQDQLDSMPSTSNNAQKTLENNKRQLSAAQSPDPKRKRPSTPRTSSNSANNTTNLNTLLVEENNHLKTIVKLMEEQRQELQSQNKNIEKLCNIFENYFNGRALHDTETQKLLKEKNELKIKLLEVETLKFEIERRRSEFQ